jgi:hypothetical protein
MRQQAVDHATRLHPGPGSPGFPSWEALVEPSRVFAHPRDVVAAPDLSREEKRAILASWASDARAVESAPGLRHCPGLVERHVPVDAVLHALRSLDQEPEETFETGQPAVPNRKCIRWLTPRLRRIGRQWR